MVNAYWINTKTDEVFMVKKRHIDFVSENLELFGITKEYIDSKYQEYDEPIGLEGKARKEILQEFLQNDWIRIRLNTKTNSWHINYSGELKETIIKCKKWLVLYAGVTYNSFRFVNINGNTKEIELEEMKSIYNCMNSGNCLECEYSTWAVGVGQGFFCTNEDKLLVEADNVKISSTGFKRFMIPRKDYGCEFYENKKVKHDGGEY